MPDPERLTISATESPALFGASPYTTRWMLYQRFANGVEIGSFENNRMDWGRRMQPLLLAAAAEDLKLEVHGNEGDEYVRRGLLGCTRDGIVICPDRGPGAIETKVVFDYRVWMTTWNGGAPPRHIEIQLQHQMLVGDGKRPFRWGTIAVLVCGQMQYFERGHSPTVWDAIEKDSTAFFADVKAKNEPDPFGIPIEAPFLAKLFPTIPDKILDLSADPAHVKTAEDVRMYQHHKDTEGGAERARKELAAKLFALARDNEKVLLPCGINYAIAKSGKGRTIKTYVPDVLSPPPVAEPALAGG